MYTHDEILIVEDEPEYRNLVNKKLKNSGFRTVLAQNAEQAIVALWERNTIGLVLLDVRLPVVNGLNVFEIIRKDFPDKRVIVTSALHRDEQRFLIEGADGYFYKFEDFSILIDEIYRIMKNGVQEGQKRNEKRSLRRISVNLLAGCEKNVHTKSFISYTKDLSPSGGRFILSEDIKIGEHLTLSLELPVHFLPLLIEGEVMWAKKLKKYEWENSGQMEVGMKFVRLDSRNDEKKLKEYLNAV